MSLRARLLAGMLVLVGVAAIALDIVTSTALHSSLISRDDQQLVSQMQPTMLRIVGPSVYSGGRFVIPERGLAPTNYSVTVYDSNGSQVINQSPQGTSGPDIPASAVRSAIDSSSGYGTISSPFTVNAQDGSSLQYRVVVGTLPNGAGAVALGESLADVSSTMNRLHVIEIVATLSVLALLTLAGIWIVRVGLRPLDEMAETAGAIAEGDLSRRVSRTDPRTEVGRLGLALNRMLTQIENAFKQRRRTEEQLRESEQRLRRFVADASHELRTPLTSVRGYSELFRQGGLSDPEELASAMARIEANSYRMGQLVDDLLLLARLDRDRTLEREPVDLAAVASDAVTDARAVEPSRPITFEVQGEVEVLGDEARLRQVAGNLLSNARMHTPPDTPVEVGVWESEGTARLEVTDHGAGVPEGAKPKVFERFYRADPSRSREHGGAGLGLAIVAAIVEAHGGEVTLDSEPGQGARFVVELPAAPLGPGTNGPPHEERPSVTPPAGRRALGSAQAPAGSPEAQPQPEDGPEPEDPEKRVGRDQGGEAPVVAGNEAPPAVDEGATAVDHD